MTNPFKIEFDTKRIFGLDILRASAILLVVILHSKNYVPEVGKKVIDNFVFDGVAVFFVLSGFLIGGILIKLLDEKEINKRLLIQFWIRRWFRTLPNYFLVLITLCLLSLIFTPNFTLSGVSKYFIFSQNLFWENPLFFPESWSLSVEEWFYLLIPLFIFLLVWIFKISSKKSLLLTALIILFLVTAFRFYKYFNVEFVTIEDWDKLFRQQVSARLDSLMYGVIGAYLNYYHNSKWLKHKNILLIIGIILLIVNQSIISFFLPVNGIYNAVFSFSVMSLSVLLLLPFLNNLKSGKGFLFRAITFVSLISYSMYLIHLTLVQDWIIGKIPWASIYGNIAHITPISKLILFWILTFIVSTLLYKYYEIPTTRLRDNKTVKKILKISSDKNKK